MTNTFKTIKAFKDYFLIKAKREGSEVSVEKALQLIQKKEPLVLLDVREKEEIALGYIEGAVFIPQGLLGEKVEALLPDKSIPVVVYCAGGIRSLAAAKLMREKGYAHVYSMAKGIDGWKEAGFGIVSDSGLTQDQLTRYSRHILLKEVGVEGQQSTSGWSRRIRMSRRTVPGSSRRGYFGNHRFRQGRFDESATTDPTWPSRCGEAQDRISKGGHPSNQPRCQGHRLPREAYKSKCTRNFS